MKNTSEYYEKMHRIGRILTTASVIIFVGIPLVVCMAYDIMPRLSDLLLAAGGLMAIFIPISIAETVAETPVMGSSYYLTCITGNVLNLKLPAALNALKIADVEQGTEEADSLIGIAVAVSSLVTMIIITLGVLMITPLKPLLGSESVSTSVNYVLPALFGCIVLSMLSKDVGGGVKIEGRLKAAVIPFVLCLIACFIIPDYYSAVQGFIMIICIPIIYFTTKKLYKKGKIIVTLPSEAEEKKEM
ncbi:MAG TPA: hypothetical protein VJ916_01040 [Anaerovoracaceae bacterium]|nr:hypothetical protein [Anaerovoracaceae bacterium]